MNLDIHLQIILAIVFILAIPVTYILYRDYKFDQENKQINRERFYTLIKKLRQILNTFHNFHTSENAIIFQLSDQKFIILRKAKATLAPIKYELLYPKQYLTLPRVRYLAKEYYDVPSHYLNPSISINRNHLSEQQQQRLETLFTKLARYHDSTHLQSLGIAFSQLDDYYSFPDLIQDYYQLV